MHKSFLSLLFLAICPLLFAQQTLNNDSVIKLVKAGLSDDLIVSTINAQAGNYDTSTDGLIALKKAGVSDRVVAAIVQKAAAPPPVAAAPAPVDAALAPIPPPAPPTADPDDPASPHDPGVYLMTTGPDGKRKMVFVDQAGIASAKTSNVLGAVYSFGLSTAKTKVVLIGVHASLRITDARPVFYMYFPPAVNLGGLGGTDIITSPSQFALLSLEIKKDHRETLVGKFSMGSTSAGNDITKSSQFNSAKLRSGVYKVTPLNGLNSGEYAFLATTKVTGTLNSATYIVYDFGVDPR
jgi:hypothetical protein